MFEFTGETSSRTLTKRLTGSANAETRFSSKAGLMAIKQKSVDTPEQAARRRTLADNCTGIFAGLTNEQVHQVFESIAPHFRISLQAVESLRRTEEAPHSKSRTVTALAQILGCDEADLYKPNMWRRRKKWIDENGQLIPTPPGPLPSEDRATVTLEGTVDSPAARDLNAMRPLFEKAIHSKPAEVVATCEQIVETEYRHLFAYFVYWMQDQTTRG